MSNADPIGLKNPETGNTIERASARAAALIEQIDQRDGLVIIPAPVLAEYLIGIDQGSYQEQIDLLNSFSCIEITSFDQLAAIECALLVNEQEHKTLDPEATKAKLRVDRQILAMTLAIDADELWTHDTGLFKKAKASGITTKSLANVEPQPDQGKLDLPSDPS